MRTLYDDTPEQQDPFEPNGARPRWEILWDMTENLQPKDSVTYVDALEAIRAEGDLEIDLQGAQKAMIKVNDKRAEHGLPLLKKIGRFGWVVTTDRKSTRLNSSHVKISYAVFCLKKK